MSFATDLSTFAMHQSTPTMHPSVDPKGQFPLYKSKYEFFKKGLKQYDYSGKLEVECDRCRKLLRSADVYPTDVPSKISPITGAILVSSGPTDDDAVQITSCGHIFCPSCLRGWFDQTAYNLLCQTVIGNKITSTGVTSKNNCPKCERVLFKATRYFVTLRQPTRAMCLAFAKIIKRDMLSPEFAKAVRADWTSDFTLDLLRDYTLQSWELSKIEVVGWNYGESDEDDDAEEDDTDDETEEEDTGVETEEDHMDDLDKEFASEFAMEVAKKDAETTSREFEQVEADDFENVCEDFEEIPEYVSLFGDGKRFEPPTYPGSEPPNGKLEN
jgi:hypothetical protein